jgi:radical SAM superfamily enzyme YgiQ (UPF0313 family)
MGRIFELCKGLKNLMNWENFEFSWSCTTRPDRLSKRLLKSMKEAGCISITFGAESGCIETLKRIRKGIKRDHVKTALSWCQDIGIRTQVNIMLGFPWEGQEQIQETYDFMMEISNMVDAFSSRGVVIPYPGTILYDIFNKEYGFSNWWIGPVHDTIDDITKISRQEEQIVNEPIQMRIQQEYLTDPVLNMDFFNYSADVKDMILRCLKYKGEQTLSKLGIK